MAFLFHVACVLLMVTVSCQVPVFREGMWQLVPGRRPDMDIGDLDRFGSFGPRNDMWRFENRLPQQFQTPWNPRNMWPDTGVPQIPQNSQTDPSTSTQWFSNENKNQQTDVTDPWTQYRLLQDSVNQGTNIGSNTGSTINKNGVGTPTTGVTVPWNSPNINSGSSGPGVTNQLHNNIIVDPRRPFLTGLNMAGFPGNNHLQGLSDIKTPNGLRNVNNGIPFGNNANQPFVGINNGWQGIPNNGIPFNGNNSMPFVGINNGWQGIPNNGIPFNGNTNMLFVGGNNGWQGIPNNGIPFNGNNNMPFVGGNNGWQGIPNNGIPFNGNNNMPFMGGNNGWQGLPTNDVPFNDNGKK